MQPQTELEFPLAAESGGSYTLGENTAVWSIRAGSNIIDLSFRGDRFKLTDESTGPTGRPRFLVNGTRQPDGKLLQGRSIPELIRKLDHHFDDLVRPHFDRMERKLQAGFERLEKVITSGKAKRTKGSSKLCRVPVKATWPQQRYTPKSALGGFARVPLPAIVASQQMAAGEYRLLQAILFCAQGTGLLTAGKKKLAVLAADSEANIKHNLRSLQNRAVIRPTGRTVKYGVREYEILTHPFLCTGVDDSSRDERGAARTNKGGQRLPEGEQSEPQRGVTVTPLKTSKKTSEDKTSKKTAGLSVPSAGDFSREDELLAAIARLCGMREGGGNGGIWRNRMRQPNGMRALRNALEDLQVKTPEQRGQIAKKGAWLTKRFEQCLHEIQAPGSWRQ